VKAVDEGVLREQAKVALLEAERHYQRARIDHYLTQLIRDTAMVDAHRAGPSSGDIGDLLGASDNRMLCAPAVEPRAKPPALPTDFCHQPRPYELQVWLPASSLRPSTGDGSSRCSRGLASMFFMSTT